MSFLGYLSGLVKTLFLFNHNIPNNAITWGEKPL